jgi:Protein of unknown function (DUF2927)
MSSRLRATLLGALLLLAACTAAAPSPAPTPPDPVEAARLETFRRLAYGPAAPKPGQDHLAKWTLPVRAALIDAPSQSELEVARRHLRDLATLTRLDVAEAAPQTANLLVFFAAEPFAAARRHRGLYINRIADPQRFEQHLAAMAPDATCFGFLWGGWPHGGSIDFAVVFVRTDRGLRTVEGCVVQQTTQVLGLVHDLDPAADSIFADTGRYAELTADDRLMVRLLYDPRLEPGMSWAEAEPLARAALRALK